ncbi:MAG: hypothetical protein MZW92_07955 [Comamonadaceae bacterium]|nr:hypothetical protein [Comamonadaceae bacterium]
MAGAHSGSRFRLLRRPACSLARRGLRPHTAGSGAAGAAVPGLGTALRRARAWRRRVVTRQAVWIAIALAAARCAGLRSGS